MTEDRFDGAVAWRISSYSQSTDANCVEAGPMLDRPERIAVRDSTRPDSGVFTTRRTAWSAFARWAAQD